jgi:hypothetical protein
MSYEPKEGFGAIFKNDKKESDKQPDYKGNIMLNGKQYELAGWIKTGAKGPFLSLKGGTPRATRVPADDDLPRRTDRFGPTPRSHSDGPGQNLRLPRSRWRAVGRRGSSRLPS